MAGESMIAALQSQRPKLVERRNSEIAPAQDELRVGIGNLEVLLKAERTELSSEVGALRKTTEERKALTLAIDGSGPGLASQLTNGLDVLKLREAEEEKRVRERQRRIPKLEAQLTSAKALLEKLDAEFNQVSEDIAELDKRIEKLREASAAISDRSA
ncbi:MAG TPA: hypothetical protein VMU16_02310 [Candidatus Binataceae bacterium]|nr:hypothetical protein [Candidatus Binataceae bacterium]